MYYPISIEKLVENGMLVKWKVLYYPADVCTSLKADQVSTKNPAKINVSFI